MSLADIQARARSKGGHSSSHARAHYFAAADKARKTANLKAAGFVVPLSEWLGHNNGPPIDAFGRFLSYCWEQAHKDVWMPPNWEIAVRRARKAHALGLSYRQYALEILERGRFLDESSASALKAQ